MSGYGNVLHGGIQATILDEIASWVIYTKVKTAGVTAAINMKFKKAIFTDKGKLNVRAKLISQDRKFATIHAELMNSEGDVCSEAEVKYFLFPIDIAKRKYHYPGHEAFFEQ